MHAHAAAALVALALALVGHGVSPPARNDLVRVFVIPHTHDDPGWQQTIQE
jgi:ABC-type sugar transport system substrate-binding protein